MRKGEPHGPMFSCRRCGAQQWDVIDTRWSSRRSAYRRRRKCEACGHRMTTWETEATGNTTSSSTFHVEP